MGGGFHELSTAHLGSIDGGSDLASDPTTLVFDGVLVLLRSSFSWYRLSSSCIHSYSSGSKTVEPLIKDTPNKSE